MRFRSLAILPLLYALVFIVVAAWLGDSDALPTFVRAQLLVLRVLASLGCLAAVSIFERGDHLRSAWLWLTATAVLILVRDLLRLASPASPSGAGGMDLAISALGVLGNLALLAGVWILARSWKVAAISLPGGPRGTTAAAVVAAVIALAVAGPSAVEQAQSLAAGNLGALTLFVSAIADILALCLLAPLFLTALGLRGGLFGWPWTLMTASILSWLFYDASPGLAAVLGTGGFPLSDVFRGLALSYMAAAGLSQRLAVLKVRDATR